MADDRVLEIRMTDPSSSPSVAVARLLRNLTPVSTGPDRYVIEIGAEVRHVFGGMLAAQALRCAQQTVGADRRVHSVHNYYLRRARPDQPLEFEVHRDSDGRSFSARRVNVVQASRTVFTMICSFHVPDRGWESLVPVPDGVPRPDEIEHARTYRFGDAFDVVEFLPRAVTADERYSPDRLWARVADRLPEDEGLHECLLLYVSDMGTPWGFATPPEIQVATSLDHAVWFHRPTRMDSWHYVGLEPATAADARGLYTGRIWALDGTQVATLVQENLLMARPSD